MALGLVVILAELFLGIKRLRVILDDDWTRDLLKKVWNFIRDWRTAVSFILAWMITNGWGYVFMVMPVRWMRIVGMTYIAFLWMPFTPEKIVTIPLAFAIKKLFMKIK